MILGRITGAPRLDQDVDGLADLVRPVDWETRGSPVDLADLHPLVAARLRTQQDVVDLTRDLPYLAPLLDLARSPDGGEAEEAEERARVRTAVLPPIGADLAHELCLPQGWLQDVVDTLQERRQLVLYGPPGTGKTHLAMRLARHLTRDPQNVTLVQFHPAYSYEDFFEGYRPVPAPDGTVGFRLRPGPFRRLADRARGDGARPYVLVIDELNRANLATVFGELYFLLEYRDEAVDLLYSSDGVAFTLPPNVFLIGTMNTADRSIALLDSAMRRRFAFVSLHPAEGPVRAVLERWLQYRGLPLQAAGLLAALNHRLTAHDLAVGPSYFMREELYLDSGEAMQRLWRTSILPLLEEHHAGSMSPAEVAERYRLEDLLAGLEVLR
jgi:5-methylcytosine-specific restriction enzyme B